ncbi:TetR/AcrR family transcriptional regulator [Rariglobus hedericola]|uniref:TetR/AcrR family transcriptional regulator n=1 Tax=Rariglobus hedericola TaxID=2597822 RepID=A0A556QGT3_9BACT|nr:TetR/AcrR family transcriptional regulator [Rariglobus hedericola]TSJ75847.1 TetR/AcrR family transcriptional regulator [Rariglobus hedericola]
MGRTSNAKEKLLDAALELIWERSYGVVTIDAICEKAGVKKGSFYYFYESKSALAVEALEADWNECGKQKWDGLFSASIPPLERIRNFFLSTYEGQLALQKEHGQVLGCPCFSVGSETSTQDEAIRLKVQEILQRQVRYFESAIRDGQADGSIAAGDAASKAKCLFALLEGSLGQARIQNDLEFLRVLPETSLSILGVARTSTAA